MKVTGLMNDWKEKEREGNHIAKEATDEVARMIGWKTAGEGGVMVVGVTRRVAEFQRVPALVRHREHIVAGMVGARRA